MLQCLNPTGTGPAIHESVERLCENVFSLIGENPRREGLERTPERFRKALIEMTSGYRMSVEEVIGEGIFTSESNGPIFVRKIEFFSLCEHHMLPFWGHVSIGYLPNEKILGLSKLARVVDLYAKRLQVQERLTREIAECIYRQVDARAVVVVVEASHMCMMMRGIHKQDSSTRTEFQFGIDRLSNLEASRIWQGLES